MPQVMIVSYSRKALGQTGDGHYSPIGGYHSATDQVLVLDVARRATLGHGAGHGVGPGGSIMQPSCGDMIDL